MITSSLSRIDDVIFQVQSLRQQLQEARDTMDAQLQQMAVLSDRLESSTKKAEDCERELKESTQEHLSDSHQLQQVSAW